MWVMIIKILLYVFLIFISIIIHELGHYIASNIYNVRVSKFCIGIGPRILKFKKYGTEFELKLFPIGGYICNNEDDIEKIKFWQEWIIDLAGVFNNLIISIISLSMYYNKNVFHVTRILFARIMKPFYMELINFNNYIQPLEENILFIQNNVPINQYLMLFGILNIILFTFNLLPLPILDGGQLIMSVVRRICNKDNKLKKYYNNITVIICIICWIILFIPLLYKVILVTNIYNFILLILFTMLFIVVKDTEIYKKLIDKFANILQ